MLALLGLLAIAGYQNKDKLKEMFGGGEQPPTGGMENDRPQTGSGGLLGGLGGLFGAASPGNPGKVISGGLGALLERFKQQGQGETAESWVRTGPNQPITAEQLEQTIGADDIRTLVEKTGLSREELLARLARTLPDAVDKYTPDGNLP
jgi:uncharacterized protein YidB (DUF937 family)